MTKYEIEWKMFDDCGKEEGAGTDIVEGKSEKDAVKNWLFYRAKDIIYQARMGEWSGYGWKITYIKKAVMINPRPKGVIK